MTTDDLVLSGGTVIAVGAEADVTVFVLIEPLAQRPRGGIVPG